MRLLERQPKGRKDTPRYVRKLFQAVDAGWALTPDSIRHGWEEGGTSAVRDPTSPSKDATEELKPSEALLEVGIEDKRLLVVESELASTIQIPGRQGNTLSLRFVKRGIPEILELSLRTIQRSRPDCVHSIYRPHHKVRANKVAHSQIVWVCQPVSVVLCT